MVPCVKHASRQAYTIVRRERSLCYERAANQAVPVVTRRIREIFELNTFTPLLLMRALVPQIVDRPRKEITHRLEMLVRAYDPCISCSTHMVQVNFL